MSDIVESEIIDFEKHTMPGGTTEEDGHTIRFILQCRNEAKLAKWNRIQQTRQNYDMFWGRHDFSHKKPGQSRESLAIQQMAVEQTSAYFQQALVDVGDDWWRVGAKNPKNEDRMKVKPDTIQAITQHQITKAGIVRHAGLGCKSGLLGGLWITKVHGCWVDSPVYVAEVKEKKGKREAKLKYGAKKVWQLKYDLVSQFNYYPDPTPGIHKLYEIEDMYIDYHEMLELAKGDDAIYDLETCQKVSHRGDDDAEEKFDKMRRTNQNETSHSFRGRVKITEFWGKILDEDGNILHDNCVATLANDRWLIRKPTKNPLWHQKSPYIATPLLDSPDAVWPKALADAGTNYNIALNELFNLMLDGAMRSVNGVSQIRQDWLDNPAQVENGIPPGTNLNVNSQCPPGALVLQQLTTGNVPPDSLNLFNLFMQEFNRSMLTSDIRQGVIPKKDVSATQVVAGDQSITGVFQGLSKQIEQHHIVQMLERSWETVAQFSDDLDPKDLMQILEPDELEAFTKLTAEERFAETVGGTHFECFGISLMAQKAQDFKKIMTLLQTIGGSEPMTEAFVKRFSFDETLMFAMRSLGLPVKQLEISQHEQEMMAGQPGGGQQPQAAPGSAPNGMSQVPSPNTGSQAVQLGSAAGPLAQAQTQGGPQ